MVLQLPLAQDVLVLLAGQVLEVELVAAGAVVQAAPVVLAVVVALAVVVVVVGLDAEVYVAGGFVARRFWNQFTVSWT